jgi:hypothetical protein
LFLDFYRKTAAAGFLGESEHHFYFPLADGKMRKKKIDAHPHYGPLERKTSSVVKLRWAQHLRNYSPI